MLKSTDQDDIKACLTPLKTLYFLLISTVEVDSEEQEMLPCRAGTFPW